MRYDDFIQRVQVVAGIQSRDDAIKVTEASLETLGERLSRVHRQHLSAQLPTGLGAFPVKRKRRDLFNIDEFYNRVAARSQLNRRTAIAGAWAVMIVLREAVSQGEISDILEEMPAEYDEFLGRQQAQAAR